MIRRITERSHVLLKALICLVWLVAVLLVGVLGFDGFGVVGLSRLSTVVAFVVLSAVTVRVLVINTFESHKRIRNAALYSVLLCLLTGITLEANITYSGRVGEDANFVNTEIIFMVILYAPILFFSMVLSLFPHTSEKAGRGESK